MPFTDPRSGAAALLVQTSGANDTVTITDNNTAGTTTVVADGKTQMFSHQFALFDLILGSKKDSLTFDLTGALSNRQENIQVSLGTGENHFTFNPDQTAITNHSDLNLNVLGHNGNDSVNVSFGEILESRVNLNERGIGGSATALATTAANDSITLGDVKTGVRNSSVDVNVDFGRGNSNLALHYGIDLGHLAPPVGTTATASDFGPSTMNVNITDSSRAQDTDNVTLTAVGEVNTASTLNVNAQLGAGNNSFKSVFDAASFQIDDDGGEFINGPGGTTAPHSGGAAHFNVTAGTGRDTIAFQSINQADTIELSGLFDINILGGSGKDNINVNFGGPGGFTDDDPFELAATNREFRLRIDGGTGDDTIKVNLSNAVTATFAYDVAIQGGSGNNAITFVGVNPGGHPSFGPGGSVFIDGGVGGNNTVDVFGNFPVVVMDAM
jgi:hypothetical protein